jgi:RimJ/RimL family protein N-acetyltransferase
VSSGFRLSTGRLVLRLFQEPDLDALLAYRNDPEVARYQSWTSFSREEAEAFLASQRDLAPGTPGEWVQIALERRESPGLIGDCAVKVLADDPRQAEIGFTLARAWQGHGYGTEAVTALLAYLFETLGLHRVFAVTDAENAAAAALLERAGLRREGHLLENIWFKGAWGSEFLYALLEREWRGARASAPSGDSSQRASRSAGPS